MTPDRRLDQLEPLMADSLQKIDRLIEGQGQILEIATRADQKADITAKGVVNLTIKVNQISDKVNEVSNEVNEVSGKVNEVSNEVNEVSGKVNDVSDRVNEVSGKVDDVSGRVNEVSGKVNDVADDQAGFRQEVRQEFLQVNRKIDTDIDSLRQEMNQRFDQLVTLIQDRLK